MFLTNKKKIAKCFSIVIIAAFFVQPFFTANIADANVSTKSSPLSSVANNTPVKPLNVLPHSNGLNTYTSLMASTTHDDKNLLYVPGEVIVKFKENKVDLKKANGVRTALQFAHAKNMTIKEHVRRSNLSVLKTDNKETVDQMVARLKMDSDVEYVEPNYRRYPTTIDTNDILRDQLWSLENTGQTINGTPDGGGVVAGTADADIDAKEAWGISQGSEAIVAVIDSGVAYNHPDLTANMWDGSDCVDENGSSLGGCQHGYDFEDNDKIPLPTSISHGTHIAGTIAAAMNNNIGIIGVAPQAKIMALKYDFDIVSEVRAIDFAIRNGAKIINASYGGYAFSQIEYEAIERFEAAGGIFVAAAGNGGADRVGDNNESDPLYPSSYNLDNIIAVAATDQNDTLATFSNYGVSTVDIGAPGVNILSTIADATAFSENFNSVTTPSLPDGWVMTGNWGTYDSAGDVVLFGDLTKPYANNADTTATSPTINLSDATGAAISFFAECDTEYSPTTHNDYMVLNYSSDGTNFIPIGLWDETTLDSDSNSSSSAWHYYTDIQLPGPHTSNYKIQFQWVTNETDNSYGGCFVDDISISKFSDGSDDLYDYYRGTSVAAPQVAGVVALVYALRPDFSVGDVKNTILSSGDVNSSLAGKTVSGKRLNAFSAVNAVNKGTLVVKKIVTNNNNGTASAENFSFKIDEGVSQTFEADGQNNLVVDAGTYTVTEVVTPGYTATYSNCADIVIAPGETKTCTITNDDVLITEPDTVAPVITLSGLTTINLDVGEPFVEPGYSAQDDTDGDVALNVTVGGDTVDTDTPNTYTITYDVSDEAGNAATQKTRTINVSDTDAPVFSTVPVDQTLEATSLEGSTLTYVLPTATDNVDGEVVVSCSPTTGTLLTIGSHAIECSAADTAENTATASFNVVVQDTIGPVMSGIPENNTVQITSGTSTEVLYALPTATDTVDGTVSVTCAPASGATFSLGATTVQCSATDDTSNITTDSFTVTVEILDGTPPVITLIGDPTMNLTFGDLFIDPGATAEDAIDGDITDNIDVTGSVDPNTSGTYTLHYNVSDAHGNAATEIIRTVIIGPFVDTVPPTITLIGASTLSIAVGTVFTDPGANVTDNVDASSTIMGSGMVTVDTVGTYTLTYTATDETGNTASPVKRTVIVSELVLSTEQQASVSQDHVTITWTTSHPATSRVVWGTASVSDISATEAGTPSYGYQHSTTEDGVLTTEHSVMVSGLAASTSYYFRPVSHGSPEMIGSEVSVTTTHAPAPARPRGGGGGGGGSSSAPAHFSITISDSPNGTIVSLSGSNSDYPYGSDQTFNIVPKTGYYISNVLVDDISAGTPTSYIFEHIDRSHSISATFSRIDTTIDTYNVFQEQNTIENVTPEDLQKIIQALLIKINSLKLKLAGIQHIPSIVFTTSLYKGLQSLDVRRLQTLLATQPDIYPQRLVTGYFGSLTEKAVQAFQLKYNVVYSASDPGFGFVGPATRAELGEVFGS